MVTTITDTNGIALPQGMAYTYDQLNRLLNAKAYVNISMANNNWQSGSTYRDRYYNAFTYDANGNILTQDRYDQSGNQIEDLTYQYAKNGAGDMLQNRLYHVNDNITAGAFSDDIDDQGTFSSNLATINTANNYEYDGEGRLVRDSIEEIDTIKWTVTGKVKTVQRTSGSSKKNLKFEYDAMGQRVAKHVYDDTWNWEKSTYYVRDPQGNVMAVYDQQVQSSTMSYKVKERDIYGSSRVGMYTDTVEMIGAVLDTTNSNHVMGARVYELSNHLGNVLTTVSDRKIAQDWNNDGVIDNYRAEIISAQDYYSFGLVQQGRSFNSNSSRYGFNSQEKDPEIAEGIYTAMYWEYDSKLGRRWNTDPVVKPWRSPYDAFSNSPIIRVDPNGDDDYFDSQGNYLGTDGGETNNIRIVTNSEMVATLTENQAAGSQFVNINPAVLGDNSQLLSDFDYNDCANEQMLINVTTYYGDKQGTRHATGVKEGGPTPASYATTTNDEYIHITTSNGKIDPIWNDSYSLQCTSSN